MTRSLLLTPGPSNTSDRVRAALSRGDECPREADFARTVTAVRGKLVRALTDDGAEGDGADGAWCAVLLGGSGTAAVEATLTTLVPRDGRVLVAENGAYGARAARMLSVHGVEHAVVRCAWDRPVEPAAVAEALGGGDFTHLFLVHHETTSGVLNPLAALARAGRDAGATVLVDAMSSFGGVPLYDALDALDAVVSSSNKCVQGAPGVSFVLVRRPVLDAAADPPRSLYLDLRHAAASQDATGQFPFTPPVQVVWALDAALDELLEETVPGRRRRFDACYEVLRSHADALGLEPLVDPAHHSRLLTAFVEPADPCFDFGALHDALRRAGVTVYPGKVPERPSFRLATMGAMTPEDVAWGMRQLARELRALTGGDG